jgi:putative ABC transport system permease protein
MIKVYVRNAFRSIIRNKAYSFISVMGLVLSVMISVILFWVINFESTFDHYHSKSERIYQLRSYNKFGEVSSHIPQGLINSLRTEVSDVEKVATIYRWDPQVIKIDNENLYQEKAFFAHPEFFEILDIEWINGTAGESLKHPGQVVLDEATAKKFFGGDAMGKFIRFDNEIDLQVSGIIKNVPFNSAFPLQMVISYETLKNFQGEYANDNYWGGGDSYFHGYVLLKPGANFEMVSSLLNRKAEQHKDESDYVRYDLNPLSLTHYDLNMDSFNYSIPKWLLGALSAIGIFLLLIACINFVNIATIHAAHRNKEIAMRKLLGSRKRHIILQFLVETIMVVLVAVVIGTIFASLLMRYASDLLNTKASLAPIWQDGTSLFLILLTIVIVLLSGVYPALVLSNFKPLQMLKKQGRFALVKGVAFRRSLIIVQFIIAQVLVLCTIIGVRQTNYFYRRDIGFDKENIITVNMPDRGNDLLRRQFRNELQGKNYIKEVAFSLTTPSSKGNWWYRAVTYHGLPNGSSNFRLQYIDTNYFSFFRIKIIAGRTFRLTDTSANNIVINEKAAKDMGIADVAKAINERITVNGTPYTIVGIIKNYNSQSLKEAIIPHIFLYGPNNFQTTSIRIDPNNLNRAISDIGVAWKRAFPDNYFNYTILSQDLKKFYGDEDKFSRFLSILALIGIIIGSLGLYGLVSLVCLKRVKEIGMRKVLGASSANILSSLVWEFLKLILLAFTLAGPIGYFLMNNYLQSYKYRIDITWWMFLTALLFSVLIGLITVSLKAIKASFTSPIKNLRDE